MSKALPDSLCIDWSVAQTRRSIKSMLKMDEPPSKRSVHSRPVTYIREHLYQAISLEIHRDDEFNEGDSRGNRSEYPRVSDRNKNNLYCFRRTQGKDSISLASPAPPCTK